MFAAASESCVEYWNDLSHFAIFPDDTQSWGTAFRHTHQKYLEALKIAHARNVLTLGRGAREFSRALARHTEGSVLALGVSRASTAHTTTPARANVRVQRKDIMKVEALRETFDAVACIDAATYLPDKQRAIEKLSALMTRGARLLLVDCCRQAGLNRAQEALVVAPCMTSRHMATLETVAGYAKIFRRCGLRIIEATDLNDRVKRNWDFGYARGLAAIRDAKTMSNLKSGRASMRRLEEQLQTAIYIKVGFDIGFLRYTYFVAERQA